MATMNAPEMDGPATVHVPGLERTLSDWGSSPRSVQAGQPAGRRLAATVFAVGGVVRDMVLVTVDAVRGRYDY